MINKIKMVLYASMILIAAFKIYKLQPKKKAEEIKTDDEPNKEDFKIHMEE